MVELARSIPGVFGARLTGGGFGGCTVNLVEAERADAIVDALREGYGQAEGMVPGIYVCKPSAGAREVTV
jgi:galactokinase